VLRGAGPREALARAHRLRAHRGLGSSSAAGHGRPRGSPARCRNFERIFSCASVESSASLHRQHHIPVAPRATSRGGCATGKSPPGSRPRRRGFTASTPEEVQTWSRKHSVRPPRRIRHSEVSVRRPRTAQRSRSRAN
jgi:hypothetical protein